ncbi:MAG TPA: NUDIX domain-containing protein [Streptosporangiales bacterium]
MTTSETLERVTGRLLPIDEDGRVLLLHGCDPARRDQPFWFTIGGGVDEGETTAQAAAREAFEETGLVVDADLLGRPVWRAHARFSFDGRQVSQVNEFYVVRVPRFEVSFAGLEELEQDCLDGHAWWSATELRTTREPYVPVDLPDRLDLVSSAGR